MNTMTTGAGSAVAAARPARRRRRVRAVLAATAATLAVWVAAVPFAGVDLMARSGGAERRVTPVAVGVATVVAGLAGWALLALLERFTTRARTVWLAVAVVVLLVSLLGPLGGVGTAAILTLLVLHLVAAAVLVPMLARTARR